MDQDLGGQVERSPFVVLVPHAVGNAIEIIDRNRALRMACIDRESSFRLAEEWDTPWIYLLMWTAEDNGDFQCYVGKASRLRDRVNQHRSGKTGWERALLVASNQVGGFDSAEIGWLEGQIHSQIGNSLRGSVANLQEPGDDTVPEYNKGRLFSVIEGVVQVMRMFGYELAEESEIGVSTRRSRKSPSSSPVTIADLLVADFLTEGEELVSTNGQWPARATVRAPDSIEYGGVLYSTPSSAGAAVRDGGATNGWVFWAVVRDGQVIPLAVLRAEFEVTRKA